MDGFANSLDATFDRIPDHAILRESSVVQVMKVGGDALSVFYDVGERVGGIVLRRQVCRPGRYWPAGGLSRLARAADRPYGRAVRLCLFRARTAEPDRSAPRCPT